MRLPSLKTVVSRFRCLRDWDVRWHGGGLRNRVAINHRRHIARVGRWSGDSPEPWDYRLHEILHCALRSLITMDRRRPKDLHAVEEELVRDICAVASALADENRRLRKMLKSLKTESGHALENSR